MAREHLTKQERHNKLRGEIVAIASRLLKAEGLSALQARRIANEANCSVGTLYNACGNLDQIILAANTLSLEDLRKALEEARCAESGHGESEPALMRMAMAYLDFACNCRPSWRAIFEHRLTTKQGVPQFYRDKQAELFAIVEESLVPVIDEAHLRQKVARALFAAVHGIIALALDEKLGDFDEPATRREITFVVSAIARGLREPELAADTFGR